MTPATLALITAVGPPDCATNKFPANSAIVFQQIFPRAPGSEPLQNVRFLLKSSRHLANGANRCQKEIRTQEAPNLKFGASLELAAWNLKLLHLHHRVP